MSDADMSAADYSGPLRDEIWRFRESGNRYQIVSVSNHTSPDGSKCQQHAPDGKLVRGREVRGVAVIHGPAKAWQRHAERVPA